MVQLYYNYTKYTSKTHNALKYIVEVIFTFNYKFSVTCPSQGKGNLQAQQTTQQGASSGNGTCVFPFTFSGKTYMSCADVDDFDGVGWCAFDYNFQLGRWGYCTASCPYTGMFSHKCYVIFHIKRHANSFKKYMNLLFSFITFLTRPTTSDRNITHHNN